MKSADGTRKHNDPRFAAEEPRVSPSAARLGKRNALANAQYRRFTVGAVCYFCSWWLQRVTIAWTIWNLTKSPLWLGVLGATEVIPIVLLSVFSGAILDMARRIDVLRICQLAAAVISVALAALNSAGELSIVLAVVIFLARGAVHTMYLPAAMAFAPTLIAKEQWASAVSVNSIVINLGMTVGPGLAGLILIYSSPTAAYIGSAALNIAYLALLYTITGREAPAAKGGGFLVEAAAGFTYALHHRVIRDALIVFFAASFGVRSIIDLLSGFAGILPNGGADVLSALSISLGAGAVTGSLWMSWRSSTRDIDHGAAVTCGLLVMTVVTAGFALSPSVPLAVACVFMMGVTISLNGIGTQTIIQHAVDDAFRGRVLALYSIIFRGAWGAGAIVLSLVADFIGLHLAGVGGALVCLVIFAALRTGGGPVLGARRLYP